MVSTFRGSGPAYPNIATAQGYVSHPAHWVDVLGLASHLESPSSTSGIDVKAEIEVHKAKIAQRLDDVAERWNNGQIDYTKSQDRHINEGNYWAERMHLGTILHMKLADSLKAKPIEKIIPNTQGKYGADFQVTLSDGSTRWLDLTTAGQTDAHVRKYGLQEGMDRADHIIAYEAFRPSDGTNRLQVRRVK